MMDTTTHFLSTASELYTRADSDKQARPKAYYAIGISLAISSGLFIGTSFVLKKIGLLRANVKYNEEAGEGYGYLKNAFWWSGMTLMIFGEVCNFGAYLFVDAILVTPLGALSVVITAILSAIFLKERLSFVGKIGCFMCIIGSVVIVLNAPSQASADTIQDMKHFVIAPGFLTYAGILVAGCTFVAWWAGPRYGKKSMLVYLSICSLMGGLSVVAIQGLGAAIMAQARGIAQFNYWFLYVLLVFIIATLVTEIIFLNKALNIFNAALVTPTYYVFFTSATIITSAILFRGFKGTPASIITVVMGFFQICAGVVLLQLSKSAKDVPDAAVFKGDLDQVRTVAEQEEPESEPKADAIRGTAAIIRRLSHSRQKNEAAEAKRIHEEKLKDQMEPIGENEQVHWDGLRRRKTIISGPGQSLESRKTLHPPLGLTHFPDDEEEEEDNWPGPNDTDVHGGFHGRMKSIRKRTHSNLFSTQSRQCKSPGARSEGAISPFTVNPRTDYRGNDSPTPIQPTSRPTGAIEMSHVFGLPPTLHRNEEDEATDSSGPLPMEPRGKPITWAQDLPDVQHEDSRPNSSLAPHPQANTAKRQFSFQNVFHRHKQDMSTESSHSVRPSSRLGLGSRQGSRDKSSKSKSATEEERLGLVKGDSNLALPLPDYTSDDEYWHVEGTRKDGHSSPFPPPVQEEKELEDSEMLRKTGDSGMNSPKHDDQTPTARRKDDDDSDPGPKNLKDWEGQAGGAFI